MDEREKQLRFLEELKNVDCQPFVYRTDNVLEVWNSCPQMGGMLRDIYEFCKKFDGRGDPIQGMDLGDVKHLTRRDLEEITDNFSQENMIRKSHLRKLCSGVIKQGLGTQEVTVKTWEFLYPINANLVEQLPRFADELILLTNSDVSSHPSLPKLIAYCCQKAPAVVYDFKLKNTVKDLIRSDNFSWDQRLKVAIDIAKVLKHLHGKQISLGNLNTASISIDEEFNIKLFEFDTHLNLENKNDLQYKGVWGGKYAPPEVTDPCQEEAPEAFGFPWVKKYAFPADVFAYGILFMELITKKECVETETNNLGFIKWIEMEYCKECSPVAQTYLDLAMRCVENDINDRPSMEQVVASLIDLVKQ